MKQVTKTTKNLVKDICDELTSELKSINIELVTAISDENYEKAAMNRDLIEITITSAVEVICTFTDLEIQEVKESFYKVNSTIFEVATELNNEL